MFKVSNHERPEQQEGPCLNLNFLGDMPGYGKEYRLTGVGSDELWNIATKLKKERPDWSVECRGERVEITPSGNLSEPHKAVVETVQKVIGQAKITGNVVMK